MQSESKRRFSLFSACSITLAILTACGDGGGELFDNLTTTPTEAPTLISSASTVPAGGGGGSTTTTPSSGSVTQPAVERFEAIAQDGEGDQNKSLANSWGFHQPRVTAHNDGTMRVLYLKTNANSALGGKIQWRLMKRAASGGWSQEATGYSYDDVYLFRDPTTDLAHVLTWPTAGVATVLSGPSYAGHVVQGNWPRIVAPVGRNYGGAGIGTDGTFCLKVSRELPSLPETSQSYTDYTCGKHNKSTGAWNWNSQSSHYIGARRAYDYVFPGASGTTGTFLATSQANPYKFATSMIQSTEDYIFNGVRFYTSSTNGDIPWKQTDILSSITMALPGQGTTPPTARQSDGFVDSKRRLLTTYYLQDPLGTWTRGSYLVVTNTSGSVLYRTRLAVPEYGYVRIFEDAKHRLWVLWTSARPTLTSMYLYRLNEGTGSSGTSTFQVSSTPTVLDAKFKPYQIVGNVFLATPRGGSAITNAVHGLFLGCDNTYVSGDDSCFPNGSGKQRIFGFRLRLPD